MRLTHMIAGRMRHGDNQGNGGLPGPGSIQRTTAGRSIVQSEMPQQEDGRLWGFQLWVNLPAAEKMAEPRFQDIDASTIPEVEFEDGAKVRVFSGQFGDVNGPVSGVVVQPLYLDTALPRDTSVSVPLPEGHTAYICPFEGMWQLANLPNLFTMANLPFLDQAAI